MSLLPLYSVHQRQTQICMLLSKLLSVTPQEPWDGLLGKDAVVIREMMEGEEREGRRKKEVRVRIVQVAQGCKRVNIGMH